MAGVKEKDGDNNHSGSPTGDQRPFALRYLRAKATRDALDADVAARGETLRRFPRGPMGLTPDAIKASPEYRVAKLAYDGAFAALRCFNASFIRTFAREIAAERQARRSASV